MKTKLLTVLFLLIPVLALSQTADVKEIFGPRSTLNGGMVCWNGGNGAHGANCDSTTTFLASPYPMVQILED